MGVRGGGRNGSGRNGSKGCECGMGSGKDGIGGLYDESGEVGGRGGQTNTTK